MFNPADSAKAGGDEPQNPGEAQNKNVSIRSGRGGAVKPKGGGVNPYAEHVKRALRHTPFTKRHADPDPLEHFVEDLWVSGRLFATLDFAPTILDPAAGLGNIVVAAKALGYDAIGTDLVKRAPFVAGGHDFLKADYKPRKPARGKLSVVSNPPFGPIREFTEKAIAISTGRVAILFPTHRLNAATWLRELPLTRVLFLKPRPSMLPGKEYVRRLAAGETMSNGTRDFAWCVFEPGGVHAPAFGWLERDGGAV